MSSLLDQRNSRSLVSAFANGWRITKMAKTATMGHANASVSFVMSVSQSMEKPVTIAYATWRHILGICQHLTALIF